MIQRAMILCLLIASLVRAESQTSAGNYRFTVITPNLIRIEYSPAKKFVDEATYFAMERTKRSDAKISATAGRVWINTGVIELSCEDVRPTPTRQNLRATIRHNKKTYEWFPGRPNTGNLGGTIQTLDGVTGPVDLGLGLLSRDGWAIVNDTGKHIRKDGWIAPRPADEGAVDWYLFGYGHDYKAALKSLAAISGPVPMPRKYVLGAWYSRYWPYTSADYRQIVKEYHDNAFPLDVIVLDMDWHVTDIPEADGGGWTGFSWDRKLLPDAEELLKWFHEQKLAVTLNLHPAKGIRKHETCYPEFMKLLGLDPAKDPTPKFDIGDPRYVDAYFKAAHNPLEDAGVDFWWMDWQQDHDIPFVPSVPGLRHLPWLNELYYRHTQRNGLRGQSFSRWGGWGDHRHPIHFSGDASTSFEMLAFEIPFTSTAGNVGCFFWSHDIGGHMGGRNEESYARWCQFGALTAALRSHSTRNAQMDRRPWKYEKWATDSMRASFHLRSRLFPYIYSSVAQSCREMIPLNRPMYLEYPEEEEAYRNPQQFMFGDHLLCAPITMPGIGPKKLAWQVVWFPPGDWYNFFTGEKCTGPGTQIVAADINEFPLYVRAGAPIPTQQYRERMAQTTWDELIVRCYPRAAGSPAQEFTLFEDDGVSTGYATGACATTLLSGSDDASPQPIHAAATVGTFPGHHADKRFIVDTPEVSTADAAKRARDRRLKALGDDPAPAALAALDGIAIVRRGDSPYGFGGKSWFELIAPANVNVDPAGTVTVGKNEAATISVRAGKRIDLPIAGPRGNSVDSIWRPGERMTISCVVDSKPCSFEFDAPAWPPAPLNFSAKAQVAASSCEKGYSAQGAIDNAADGYPRDKRHEWASNGEKAGAKITLRWDKPITASHVYLFDRPNKDDQLLEGILRFSDGSSVKVGPLENSGADAAEISFSAKVFDSLELEISKVSDSTHNAGIAEIAVFP